MTRWAMVADLRRCVGCQTCTAACRHANATPPGVQWRRVLDMEFGEYPDVQRAFVPVGCQHCDDPPCMDVCPTTATRQRADGIVTIDYDLCIGCAYCAVACPYQARYKTERASFAYGEPSASEASATTSRAWPWPPSAPSASTASTPGWRKGLKPASTPRRRRPASTPASRRRWPSATSTTRRATVSQLLAENQHFRMHEELGTGPGFYYLWDRGARAPTRVSYRPQPLAADATGTGAPPATSSAVAPAAG